MTSPPLGLSDVTGNRDATPDRDATRSGELATPLPPTDEGIVFIGRIETPFGTRADCPRQGAHDGPVCCLVLRPPYDQALAGLDAFETIEVLYWLHEARRDLLLQAPKSDGETFGTFALRSPLRPNPIGTSLVKLVGVEGNRVSVRGLDCLDGTPLIDIKPDRCAYSPRATGKPIAR
ncbi:MAG: tRNA (N6-threonylcarbamoyladenosine(37)-N6)-methyltransferase TrmO [Hyphomicrobiaceae bacterium]|nr:tRNA (N6-threonylcarbamoyladenosine(37)-N6)-methyltransferase TrmO [Hyphomicrobiaceae bacterium]